MIIKTLEYCEKLCKPHSIVFNDTISSTDIIWIFKNRHATDCTYVRLIFEFKDHTDIHICNTSYLLNLNSPLLFEDIKDILTKENIIK